MSNLGLNNLLIIFKRFTLQNKFLMKKIIIVLFIICVGGIIYSYIIQPENGFNIYPYAIFVSLTQNYVGRGNDERIFIIVFDLLFALLTASLLCRFIFLMFFKKS